MGKAVGWTGDGSDFKSDLDVHAVEFLRKGLERQGGRTLGIDIKDGDVMLIYTRMP
jgi:hypothetical protein